MGVNCIEVWSSGVHTPNNQSSSNMALIPAITRCYYIIIHYGVQTVGTITPVLQNNSNIKAVAPVTCPLNRGTRGDLIPTFVVASIFTSIHIFLPVQVLFQHPQSCSDSRLRGKGRGSDLRGGVMFLNIAHLSSCGEFVQFYVGGDEVGGKLCVGCSPCSTATGWGVQ